MRQTRRQADLRHGRTHPEHHHAVLRGGRDHGTGRCSGRNVKGRHRDLQGVRKNTSRKQQPSGWNASLNQWRNGRTNVRNKKRMLAAGLIAVALLSTVSGCGSTTGNMQDPQSIQGLQEQLVELYRVPGAQEMHQTRRHRTTAIQQIIMHRITAAEHHRQACHNTQQQVLPQW